MIALENTKVIDCIAIYLKFFRVDICQVDNVFEDWPN